MSEFETIRQPRLLQFTDGPVLSHGPDQEWYPRTWQRQAGCGPTVCAAQLWYLARTRAACAPLFGPEENTRACVLPLMEQLWEYITPGNMGVNKTEIFSDGALRFGADRGVPLRQTTLSVPHGPLGRPSAGRLYEFLRGSFARDLPVAFLNLSNGAVHQLHGWHWVALTGVKRSPLTVIMLDDGKESHIDLGLWLKTTVLGGGFITLAPAEEAPPPDLEI